VPRIPAGAKYATSPRAPNNTRTPDPDGPNQRHPQPGSRSSEIRAERGRRRRGGDARAASEAGRAQFCLARRVQQALRPWTELSPLVLIETVIHHDRFDGGPDVPRGARQISVDYRIVWRSERLGVANSTSWRLVYRSAATGPPANEPFGRHRREVADRRVGRAGCARFLPGRGCSPFKWVSVWVVLLAPAGPATVTAAACASRSRLANSRPRIREGGGRWPKHSRGCSATRGRMPHPSLREHLQPDRVPHDPRLAPARKCQQERLGVSVCGRLRRRVAAFGVCG
jgi:hypothetical protein